MKPYGGKNATVLQYLHWFFRRFFVAVVLLGSLAGYLRPGWFEWVGWTYTIPLLGTVDSVVVGLGIIMFGMGMTLSTGEVADALTHPGRIGLGVICQFLLMPLLALVLVLLTGAPTPVALGVVLLGCCPGGTASNVMTFLADADVPLSIAVTVCGTLLAPLLTPWLFWLYGEQVLGVYLGEPIDVPVLMLTKTIVVVVVPVLLGLGLKWWLDVGDDAEELDRVFGLTSILVIALIVAYVVGSVDPGLLGRDLAGMSVTVFLHNGLGLAAGFLVAVFWGLPGGSIRALSLEVGMQNSGLAIALAGLLRTQLEATGQFAGSELALLAVPGVLFSVWHNVTGPLLASVWNESA